MLYKRFLNFLILTFCILIIATSIIIPQEIAWTYRTNSPVYSSPSYSDGSLYIGSDDFNLYCINASAGTVNWKYATGGIIRSKPLISDETIFITSDDGFLYAFNKNNGKRMWQFKIGKNAKRILPSLMPEKGEYWDYMQSSPVLNKGIVFVGSGDSCIYAVNSITGKMKWKKRTQGIVRSTPTVANGFVYVGSFDGYLYALDEEDGSEIWKADFKGNQYKHIQSSPLVHNNIVYCGGRNPYFYALDAKTGNEIWKYCYDFSWVESSAVAFENTIYVGSSDLCHVYAFNAKNGSIKWLVNLEGDTWSTPFYQNGVLYIGLAGYREKAEELAGGGLLAIDAVKGKVLWKVDCNKTPFIGGIVSSPTVNDKMIYYGSLDGKIYALKILN